ncbi:MAG: hypothetical protein ABSG01_17230, partial [Anaerolineales bacterium]
NDDKKYGNIHPFRTIKIFILVLTGNSNKFSIIILSMSLSSTIWVDLKSLGNFSISTKEILSQATFSNFS